jgi:hypothetical protein
MPEAAKSDDEAKSYRVSWSRMVADARSRSDENAFLGRGPHRSWDLRRAARLATVVRAGLLMIVAVPVVPEWFPVLVPEWTLRHFYIRVLLVGEVAYAVLLALVPIALVISAVARLRARQCGRARPWLARGVALCAGSVRLGQDVGARGGIPLRLRSAFRDRRPELDCGVQLRVVVLRTHGVRQVRTLRGARQVRNV